jgi:hypothetical protein
MLATVGPLRIVIPTDVKRARAVISARVGRRDLVLFAGFLITDFPSLPLPIDPWPSVSIRGRVFPDPRSSAQIRG